MPVVVRETFERVLVVGPYESEWVGKFLNRGVSFVNTNDSREVEVAMEAVQAVFIYSPLDQPLPPLIKQVVLSKARRLKISHVLTVMIPATLLRDLNACLRVPPSGEELASEPMSDHRFVESVAPPGWKFKSHHCASSIRHKAELAGRRSLTRNEILQFLSRIKQDRKREAGVEDVQKLKRKTVEDKYPPGILSAIANAPDVEIHNELILKAMRSPCATVSSFIRRLYRAEFGYTDFEWSKAIWKLATQNGFPALQSAQVYSEIQNIKRCSQKRNLGEVKEDERAS